MKRCSSDKTHFEDPIFHSPENRMASINDLRAERLNKDRPESIENFRRYEIKDDQKMESIDELRLSHEDSALSIQEMNNPEMSERRRLGAAAENLKKSEWIKPEKWKELDETQKKIALDRTGEVLSKTYNHPKPPLYIETGETTNYFGKYSDGSKPSPSDGIMRDYGKEYSINSHSGGSEYGIEMNKTAELPEKQKLLGDNPREALSTYAHEYRHSYQTEQISMYEKPQFRHLVDNPSKAKEWSENLKNYIEPPDEKLLKEDPEAYGKQFKQYENQPVEKNSNEFAEKLINEIYG